MAIETPKRPAPNKHVPYQRVIENPLGLITEWPDHERILIGVHRSHGFNNHKVPGVISIGVFDDMEDIAYVEEGNDFRDCVLSSSVEMTADGARALADALYEAARYADASQTEGNNIIDQIVNNSDTKDTGEEISLRASMFSLLKSHGEQATQHTLDMFKGMKTK